MHFRILLASIILLGMLGAARVEAMTLLTEPLHELVYLEGKKHYDAGNPENADQVWTTLSEESPLRPACLILLARAYGNQGKLDKAEQRVRDVLTNRNAVVYHGMAREMLVELLLKQKKPEARDLLADMLAKAPEKDKANLTLKLANAERAMEKFDVAGQRYRLLMLAYPTQFEGLKASEELAWMVMHGKAQKPAFAEEEELDRAQKLAARGRFDLAADVYENLLKKKPDDTKLMLKLGDALFRDRKNHRAIIVIKDAMDKKLPEKDRLNALYILSRLYWRLDRNKDFEQVCKELIEKGTPEMKRKVLFNVGAHYFERGKYKEAQEYFDKALKLSMDASAKVDVKWKMAWIKYRTQQYEEASDAFREVRQISKTGRILDASRYWEARSLLNDKRNQDAERLFKQIRKDSPLGYYGIESAALLKSMNVEPEKPEEAKKTFPTVTLTAAQAADPAIVLAVQFLDMGLPEFAVLHLETLPAGTKSSPAVVFLTARAVHAAEKYHVARDLLYKTFSAYMDNPPADAPPEFTEMAFPRVLREETVALSRKYGVDPNLVWSVIRQESRYDPGVVSPAGALGLMQLTPQAAGAVRKGGKIPATAIAEILDPRRNIGFGVKVLSKNLQNFRGKVVPAVASYNADIRKVRTWMGRNGHLKQDEFIENIPYAETRGYVKNVLAGYHAYSRLHGAKDLAGLW